jgi:hypothetical protein
MSKSPNRFVPSGKLKALELREGSSIPVSNALSGRIRYNEVTNHLELSENTGAFASILGTEHGIVTLTPLGGGADDAPQIAAALASGKIVILAPGTWNLGGVVTVYTQAQELHGPAPASRGAIRLSYGDELTHAATTEGMWSRATYDATFDGVVDHTIHDGYNWLPFGGQIDPAYVSWYWQMEATYKTAAAGPVISEWFLQYQPAGGGVDGRRPIGCMVDHTTGEGFTGVQGAFTVETDATGVRKPRVVIPNDVVSIAHLYSPIQVISQASANIAKWTDTWSALWNGLYLWTKKFPILFFDTAGTGYCQMTLNGSDEFCVGTTDANAIGEATHVPSAVKLGAGVGGVQHHGECRERGPGGTKPVNVEAIGATRTLVAGTDAQIQILTAAAAQDVVLPADTCTGLYYWIEQRGANTITIQKADGTHITTLTSLQGCWVKCTGATWVAYGKVLTIAL